MLNPFITAMVVVSVGSLAWQEVVTAPTSAADTGNSASASDIVPDCKDNKADIYFLLDCSSSMWIVDFDKMLEFVVSLVNHLDVNPNATRVGLGVFSNDFYHYMDIGDYQDKDNLVGKIRSAPYLSGNTLTGKALQGMRTIGFRADHVRPNVTKIGFVITDGRSRHRTNTLSEATLAKEEHIWLFAIGVGSNVDKMELEAIASSPKKQFSSHVNSFDILPTLSQTLAASSCTLEQPQSGATCGRTNRGDVMFVYNAASMGIEQLRLVKDFISHVVGQFSMATGNIRAGVVSRASQGGDIDLEEFIRNKNFINALMTQPKPKMSALLEKVRSQSFEPEHGGRHNAKKLVIAFVDDVMEDRDDVFLQALLLKYNDALIHAITLGDAVNPDEVQQLVSAPNYITSFESYSDLENPKKRKEFLDKFCEGL